MRNEEICWYTRRHELEPRQVFVCQGGLVMLDSRVAGDGTKWRVLDWHEGWCDYGSEIEPGDLRGEPIESDLSPEAYTAIAESIDGHQRGPAN